MASSITVESLDLGESLGEEKDALVTHKRLAEKAGLSEKIATFLVSTVGCRTVEDLENVSEAQVDEEIIPAIADLDVPLVMGSRLKELIKQHRRQQGSRGTGSGRALWKTRMSPCHWKI